MLKYLLLPKPSPELYAKLRGRQGKAEFDLIRFHITIVLRLSKRYRGYLLVLVGYGFLVHERSQKIIFSRVAQPGVEISFSMITSESKIRILPKTNKFYFYFILKMNFNTLHNIGLNYPLGAPKPFNQLTTS